VKRILTVISEITLLTFTFVNDLVEFVSVALAFPSVAVEGAFDEFAEWTEKVRLTLTLVGLHVFVLGGDHDVCIGFIVIH